MLEKFFTLMGIGSAEVDLKIPKPHVHLGDNLEGTIKIKGGNVEQEIEKIEISLMLKSSYHDRMQSRLYNQVVSSVTLAERMVIKPDQEEVIPIIFEIPFTRNLPISRGRTEYYLKTNLDIRKAVDPVDHNEIVVVPNKQLKLLFDAFASLGLHEEKYSGDFNGILQEFKFTPTTFFCQELKEIKVYAKVKKSEMDVTMKIHKKNRGLVENIVDDIDPDEVDIELKLIFDEMESVSQIADSIKGLIEQECHKIT